MIEIVRIPLTTALRDQLVPVPGSSWVLLESAPAGAGLELRVGSRDADRIPFHQGRKVESCEVFSAVYVTAEAVGGELVLLAGGPGVDLSDPAAPPVVLSADSYGSSATVALGTTDAVVLEKGRGKFLALLVPKWNDGAATGTALTFTIRGGFSASGPWFEAWDESGAAVSIDAGTVDDAARGIGLDALAVALAPYTHLELTPSEAPDGNRELALAAVD